MTPTVAAVSDIRAEAVRSLRAWSVDTQAVEIAELVTNAVRASRRVSDKFIAVRLSARDGTEEAVRPGDHDQAVPESSGGFTARGGCDHGIGGLVPGGQQPQGPA
nr:hypothetical protein [Frankia sp. Cr2]